MSVGPRVLVVGAGGLGCPALLALGAAGVRQVTVMDPDRVELTNLHRQILYAEGDLGAPKATLAAQRFEARFPGARAVGVVAAFEGPSADLLREHDLVLDGTDRVETKLMLADACLDAGVPFVFAGVVGTDGQVLGVTPGVSACPRCLFDEAPPPGAAPSCAELGIIGPIAGVVAARQVAVGMSLGGAAPEQDVLWVYDGLRDRERRIPLARQPDCRGCGARQHARGSWEEPALTAAAAPAAVLDLATLVCPATYVATARALESLPVGGRLWVHLGSDEARRNVPASARAAGHRVLARETDGHVHRILLERGPPTGRGEP